MLLLIDNYDSFTFNIVHAFHALSIDVKVVQANETFEAALNPLPHYLVIGPGPGDPSQTGISKKILKAVQGKIPILGICLGHQLIGEFFGGKVIRAKTPKHGKVDRIYNDGKFLFKDVPSPFLATRYHSLILDSTMLPSVLEVTATSGEGEIMGVRHKIFDIEGVQFHPESIASEHGEKLLRNFIKQNLHQDNGFLHQHLQEDLKLFPKA